MNDIQITTGSERITTIYLTEPRNAAKSVRLTGTAVRVTRASGSDFDTLQVCEELEQPGIMLAWRPKEVAVSYRIVGNVVEALTQDDECMAIITIDLELPMRTFVALAVELGAATAVWDWDLGSLQEERAKVAAEHANAARELLHYLKVPGFRGLRGALRR